MHVGICGYATSGKDVVADILVEHFGFVKVNMSDALHKYLLILNPYVKMGAGFFEYSHVVNTLGYTKAKECINARELLQRLGTDVGRAIDPDMWVKELRKEVEKWTAKGENVVTTGIRYENEASGLDLLIHVNRPGVGPANNHTSEDLSDLFDYADCFINNTGTLENLRDVVLKVFKNIGFKTIEFQEIPD